MSTKTVIKIISNEELRQQFEKFLHKGLREEAKKALQADAAIWKGIEWFISWFEELSKKVFLRRVIVNPINGEAAKPNWRYGNELFFTVIGTFFGFLKAVFSSVEIWEKAHDTATEAWFANKSMGLSTQASSYGEKMAGYFLEVITQCFERAIKRDGISDDDKQEIYKVLKSLSVAGDLIA